MDIPASRPAGNQSHIRRTTQATRTRLDTATLHQPRRRQNACTPRRNQVQLSSTTTPTAEAQPRNPRLKLTIVVVGSSLAAMFCLSKMMFLLPYPPGFVESCLPFAGPLPGLGLFHGFSLKNPPHLPSFLETGPTSFWKPLARPGWRGTSTVQVVFSLLRALAGSRKDAGLRPGQPPGLFVLLPSRPPFWFPWITSFTAWRAHRDGVMATT